MFTVSFSLQKSALDRLHSVRASGYQSPEKHKALVEAWTAVRDVAKDFVYAAQSYGKIIIGEKFLPENEKTIKAADVGGIAGGTVLNQIYFER